MISSTCHVCITLCFALVTIATMTNAFPASLSNDATHLATDTESLATDDDAQLKHSSARIKRYAAPAADYYSNNNDAFNSRPQYFDKRGPQLSINQDLMSIASMLRNEAGRRRMAAAENFLHKIGKRNYDNDMVDALAMEDGEGFGSEEEGVFGEQPQEYGRLQKRSDAWSSFPFKRTTRGR